jgi:tetratricopeptide (TPR) repeat protein
VERAIQYYEQGLPIAREIGDRGDEGSHLANLGSACYCLGQVERAVEHYEQALAICREIGDRRGEENLLGSLGLAYAAMGQVERAIEHHEQALAICRQIGDRRILILNDAVGTVLFRCRLCNSVTVHNLGTDTRPTTQ